MNALIRDEEIEDYLPVPLSPELIAWLTMLSRITGHPPGDMVASMLDHIRRDDLAAHAEDKTKH